MDRFDGRGMLVFPNPEFHNEKPDKNIVVIGEAFGPSGKSLINNRVHFGKFPGIIVRVRKKAGSEGLVGISPVYKSSSRVSLDIDLENGEEVEMFDPSDGSALPIFDKCEKCGSDLVAIYLTKDCSLNDSAVICRRIGCSNEEIHAGGEILNRRLLESEDHYSG